MESQFFPFFAFAFLSFSLVACGRGALETEGGLTPLWTAWPSETNGAGVHDEADLGFCGRPSPLLLSSLADAGTNEPRGGFVGLQIVPWKIPQVGLGNF